MANSKLRKKQKRWLIPLLVFLVFGGVGAYFLASSLAATPKEPAVYITTARLAKSIDPSLNIVADNVPNDGDYQQVIRLEAGQSANLTIIKGGRGETLNQNCYFMRAPEQAVTVEITGWARKKTVTLSTDKNYYYHKYCVEAQSGNRIDYNVKVISGGPVYIYQMHAELVDSCTTRTFQVGSPNDYCIKYIQTLLRYHIYSLDKAKYPPADGVYSTAVMEAVKTVQTRHKEANPKEFGNEVIDGIVDPGNTWFMICNPLKGPPPAWFTNTFNDAGCSNYLGPL
jgi:hypothetical protein